MRRGRAWGIAAAGGAALLVLIAGFGNQWTVKQLGEAFQNPPTTSGFNFEAVTVVTSPRFHFTSPDAQTATLLHMQNTTEFLVGEWITVLATLLLTVVILRMVAHSLDYRRSGFGAFIGAWGATGIAAAIGFLGGGIMLWYSINQSLNGRGLTDYLFVEAKTGASYGILIGWLVGLAALAAAKSGLDPDAMTARGEPDEGFLPPPGPLLGSSPPPFEGVRPGPLPPPGPQPGPPPPGGPPRGGDEPPPPFGGRPVPPPPPPPPFGGGPPPPPPGPPIRPGGPGPIGGPGGPPPRPFNGPPPSPGPFNPPGRY